MTKLLESVNAVVWGVPTLVLVLGVGLYLSLRLGFLQITLLPRALRTFAAKLRPGTYRDGPEGVSSFRALCTALGATVGTGNLVGVAGAICLGGPGAVFWIWVCGILGMAVKYAEVILAVRYRVREPGGYAGGPMYVIVRGLGERWRPLALGYCLCGLAASFGIGNGAQINAVVTGIRQVQLSFGGNPPVGSGLAVGVVLAAFLALLLSGGAKRIGAAAETLVPVAAVGYMLLCGGVLITRFRAIPEAFCAIVRGAFDPRAVTGGMLGAAFQAMRFGCSRGVFTNEAGMGTASIAHAGARVDHPAEQGLLGIVEVFLDTIVICTLTALVILVSGVCIPYGQDVGAELTTLAFSAVYGKWASLALAAALALFAVATVLGWSFYGGRCAEFLFGRKIWRFYVPAQAAAALLASVMDTRLVWQLSELMNGLMVIPNLITLAVLTPELCRLTKEYRKSDGRAVSGGTYADFH